MSAAVKPSNPSFDPLMVGALIALIAIGAIMIGSASISIAERETGDPFTYLLRHAGAVGMGLVAMGLAAWLPTDLWHRLHWLLAAAGIGLLALVLVPGVGLSAGGATRWLPLGPVTFQASEPARLCLLMFIAAYAVRRSRDLSESLGGLIKPLVVVGAAGVLLLAEPDYGATVVLVATSFTVLFVAGARLRDVLMMGIASVAALAVLATSSQYRVDRILSFRRPWEEQFGDGYQLTQSLIAIGRGQWGGVGLGESVQKLFYLPEAHTDFVFAVLVEELGFVGASIVIALFAIVVYRALALGREALESGMPFQGLVAIGIGVMIGFEAFINIGVNAGLLPTKGLPLPLISYGRASTVVTLVAIGLLLRIYRELHGGQKRLVQRGHVR